MARVPDLRQIKKEDYDKDNQKLIDQLGFPLNNFMQQVISVLKNGIDFNNLNQQLVSFTASVDGTGKPTTSVQFQNNLPTKLVGIICISAVNTSSPTRFPEATPFISYTTNNNLITVTNITGLGIPSGQTNSDTYTFNIQTIGANLPTV